MVTNTEYKIANCTVIPDLLILRIEQKELRIEPRLMAVLVFLIKHPQTLVTREELVRNVWRGQVVSDNAINRTIAQLRKLLGDTPNHSKIIETIPKKGYRFIGQVETIGDKDSSNEQATEPKTTSFVQQQHGVQKQDSVQKQENVRDKDNVPDEDDDQSDKGFNNLVWRSSIGIGILAVLIVWLSPKIIETEQTSRHFTPSTPIPITSLSGVEAYPAFSNNGHWIAYSHQPESGGNWNLVLQSLEDSRQFSLTHAQGLNVNPVFARNSSLLAYTRWNNINERKCSIHLIDLSTKLASLNSSPAEDSSRQLFNCGTRALPRVSWHPKQNSFYYFDRDQINQPYTVYKYFVDTGKKEQVTLPPQGEQGHYWVEVSPNGDKIAVLSYIDANRSEILIIDEKSLQIKTRLPIDSYVNRLNWLTESQLLLHTPNQLKQVSIDSPTSDQLITPEAFPLDISDRFIQPQVSQNSAHLALVEMWQEQNIWQSNFESNGMVKQSERKRLIESSRNDYSPKFAHNSDRIAFFSSRSGKVQIWLSDQYGQLKQLTHFNQGLNFSPLRWSQDDRYLLFSYEKSIYQLHVTDGTLTKVIDSPFGVYNYAYSADNNDVIASSKQSGDWQLWRFAINTDSEQSNASQTHSQQSEPEQLTFAGGYGPRTSADGQWIYFTKFHQDGLWRMPFQGGPEELISNDFSKLNWLHWQLSDGGAYYLDINHTTPGVYYLSFADDSRKLVLSKQPNQSNDFSISRSSETVIFSKTDSQKGDIYLVKLQQDDR